MICGVVREFGTLSRTIFRPVLGTVLNRAPAVPVDGDERVLVLDEGLAEGVLGGGGVQDQRVARGGRHDLLVAEAERMRKIESVALLNATLVRSPSTLIMFRKGQSILDR